MVVAFLTQYISCFVQLSRVTSEGVSSHIIQRCKDYIGADI